MSRRMTTISEMAIPSADELEEELNRVQHRKKYIGVLRSTVFTLVSAAAVVVLVCMLVFPVLRIYGSSMEPTLHDGDIVVCLKNGKFQQKDLIGFYYNNKILVKRVIAGSGDWVYMDDRGNVTVNDVRVAEPYVTEKSRGECDLDFPYQVPENRLFVMGDHRKTSIDSRSSVVGCAAEEQVVGKILFRIWPLDRMGRVN